MQTQPDDANTATPYAGNHSFRGSADISARKFINCPDVHHFDHWEGDASGTSTTMTITMNSNKNITAYFSQLSPTQHTLTINVSGQGTTTPSSGTYTDDEGIPMTITATPVSSRRFDHWSGDASGSSPTLVITIYSNKSVTAYFKQVTTIGGNVQITKIFYDGLVYRVESDEYVEITNLGTEPQDLAGWVLKDISEGYPSFTFPYYVLAPSAAIRFYTNETHLEWVGFSLTGLLNFTDNRGGALFHPALGFQFFDFFGSVCPIRVDADNS